MTGAPRQHRAGLPIPTERDLRLWRDLIVKADKCARRPTRDAQALHRAAMRCRKAVMPVGHQHGQSPFVDLNKACESWRDLPAGDREAFAAGLADKISLCRAILNGDNDAPPRPQRKDIFE